MRLDVEDAFTLLLLREAERAGVVAETAPRIGPAASADTSPVRDLLEDARARLRDEPATARLWRQRDWILGRRPGAWLALPAFLIALLATGLAADGRLNILTPPLVGVILWQWVMALVPLLRRLLPARSRGGGIRAALLALARRIPGRGGAGRLVPPLADAWLELAGGRALAPVAAGLHAAAAAFALGAIGALYLDGLGTEYHAYWESTFLGPDAVTTLVTVLLGPVSLLGGPGLPDADRIAAMATEPVPAARWIHLWALALLFWAVLPRTVLAIWQTRRAHRPIAFPDQDAWLQRSLAARAGTALRVRVSPLGYRPGPRALEKLGRAMHERLGPRARLEPVDPVPWSVEPDRLAAGDIDHVVLLVNPAQTPEEDVHGPLLDALERRGPVTVALDAAAYDTSDERRSSRIGTWRRMLDARGSGHLVLEA